MNLSLRQKESALWIMTLIVLAAAWLRFVELAAIPPGFHFDLAFNAFDIARLLEGDWRIFFPANTGREPLFIYLQAASAAVFGLTPYALRLVSAGVGILILPLVYRFAAELLESRGIGLLAALLSALSFWLIFYSRDGLRVILVVPFTILTFWMFWRGLDRGSRRAYVLCGTFMALAMYTYVSARLLPLCLIALTIIASLANRKESLNYLKGLGWALAAWAILVLPLAAYLALHPEEFLSHSLQVSIFAPDVSQTDFGGALIRNALAVVGMFVIAGDDGIIRNLPGRPVFDPFTGLLFVVGLIVWLYALFSPKTPLRRRLAAAVLAVWLTGSLAVSLFSDDAPNFLRTLPAAPAVMIIAAWGLGAIWARIERPHLRKAFIVLSAALIATSAWLAYRDYFVVYARDPGLYYAMDEDKLEIAAWLNQRAGQSTVYLAPLYYQQGTIAFLTRKSIIKSFDSRDTLVLPTKETAKDVYYAFPPEQARRTETLAARLGLGAREDVVGSNGAPILLVYRVPVERLPSATLSLDELGSLPLFSRPSVAADATWGKAIQLLGLRIGTPDAGKQQLSIILYFASRRQLETDLTFSVKVRGEDGRVWGQEDRMPGSNSYPTSSWTEGEIIVERFWPEFDECPPPGEYDITLEVYDSQSGAVLTPENHAENVLRLGKVRLLDECRFEPGA